MVMISLLVAAQSLGRTVPIGQSRKLLRGFGGAEVVPGTYWGPQRRRWCQEPIPPEGDVTFQPLGL